MRLLLASLIGVLATACGEQASTPSGTAPATTGGDPNCATGERAVSGQGCVRAGVQDDGCPAGEIGVEGGCRPAGIPPEMCAAGFEPDGAGGCDPILPDQPCPDGKMAVPGETTCRDVAPCGNGTWGDIATGPDTEYVDAAYTGGASNGSQAAPWTTIQEGIDAAARDAVVAVAAGSYTEDLILIGQPSIVQGRCPAMVEVVGTTAAFAAIVVRKGADGSELRDLAVRGAARGILVSAAEEVLIDRVWVHDTEHNGIQVEENFDTASVRVERSLVERARRIGVIAIGEKATLEATVVRHTQPTMPEQEYGRGVQAEFDPETGRRGTLTVRSSVVEHNHNAGVFLWSADAAIDGTVVRDTAIDASNLMFGRGIDVEVDPVTAQGSTLELRSSVVERSRDGGIFVLGSQATIEGTVVRDVEPDGAGTPGGRGVSAEIDLDTRLRASVSIRSSLISRANEAGVSLFGADATIEGLLVEDTRSNTTALRGRGINVQDDATTDERSNATIRSSRITRNREVGVFVQASDATIEGTLVEDTQPQEADLGFGRGISVQRADKLQDPQRANVTIHASAVVSCLEYGIIATDSDTTIDATLVQGIQARASDGAFGDGIAVDFLIKPALIVVTASRVEGSARAGVASFGGGASIGGSVLECNAIHLNGEANAGAPFSFEDLGGNVCGCAGTETACKVLSSGLAPPEEL